MDFLCRITMIPLFIVVGFCCIQGFGKDALILAEKGQSNYEIIIKANAPKATVFAAEELKQYFKKVTGADLSVKTALTAGKKAIYIGSNPALPEKPEFDPGKYTSKERFLISDFNDNIVIMGADCDVTPIGTDTANFSVLFGIYEFIERFLGVRWYAPGDLGECYKKKETIEVSGLPIEQEARCWRRYYWPFVFNESTSEDSVIWGRRMKGFGNKAFNANHSMQDFYFPFKDTRPEIFALNVDGSRHFGALKENPNKREWSEYPHFCFSNPETLKAYKDMIDAYYKKEPLAKEWQNCHPDDNFIYVVPDDNYRTNPCYCKDCQAKMDASMGDKGFQSNLVWGFIAKIAEYAKEKYPDKKVVGLAYEGYLLPPKGIELPDNVVTHICVNPYIIYSGLPEYEKQIEETLSIWSKKVKEISIWHYYLPYADFPYMMPSKLFKWYTAHPEVKACFMELMDTNLRRPNVPINPLYKGKRVVASDLAQVYLDLYFSMKSMWSADCNVEKELDLHYELFFGPAAQPMKEFYQLAITRWENINDVKAQKGAYSNFSGKDLYEKIYTKEVVDKLSELLDKASSMTTPGDIYRKRLDWIKASYFDAFKSTSAAFFIEANSSKSMVIFPTQDKPEIDGNIDKDYWKNKEEFSFARIDAPLPPRFPTVFKLGMDNDNIYLSMKATDPDSAAQKLVCTFNDAQVYTDDSYELFICPDAEKPGNFYQIVVNLNDIVFDRKAQGTESDIKWNSGIISKTKRGDGFWTSEFALPLKNMEIKTSGNPVIRFNVCRNKRSGVGENHEASQWGTTYGSFCNTNAMPRIYITGDETGYRETFDGTAKPPVSLSFNFFTKDSKEAKNLKDVCFSEIKEGYLVWKINYPTPEVMYKDYAILYFPKAKDTDVSKSLFCETKFRKPDALVGLTAAYAFQAEDGKTYSDYFRLSQNESFPKWRIRSFNIQTDGYNARKKIEKEGISLPKPEKLIYFALYSSSGAKEEYKGEIDIDYVRFTSYPIKGK